MAPFQERTTQRTNCLDHVVGFVNPDDIREQRQFITTVLASRRATTAPARSALKKAFPLSGPAGTIKGYPAFDSGAFCTLSVPAGAPSAAGTLRFDADPKRNRR